MAPPRKRKKIGPRPGLPKQPRSDGIVHVDDEEVRYLTKAYWPSIRTQKRKFITKTMYNFRTSSVSPQAISKRLTEVYNDQASYNGKGSIFKANIRTGMILMDRVTTQLFFYHAEKNTKTLNEKPIIIRTKADLDQAVDELSGQNFHEQLVNNASPNSRFVFFQPTNIEIEVVPLEDHPLRGDLSPADFPDSVTRRRDVYCFIRSNKGKILLHDNLCLFRCLSVYLFGKKPNYCEKEAKRLAKEYCNKRGISFANFPGITMGELELVENHFDVGIKVYGCENGLNRKFLCRQPQAGKNNGVCQLFRFKNRHFCLIKPDHEDSFLGGFQCKKCQKLFRRKRDSNLHEAKCKGASRVLVKTGKYLRQDVLVDELEHCDMVKNKSDVFQPYFVVFDAESSMEKPTADLFSAKTVYDFRHKAIFLCAATNIPGETVKVYVNHDHPDQPDQYLREFLTQVEKWRVMAADININRVQYILDEMDNRIAVLENNEKQFYRMRRMQNLRKKLCKHMETINLLSFNGRSYDISLMRNHLLPLIHQFGNGLKYIDDEEYTDDDDDIESGEMLKERQKSGIHFLLKSGASRYDAILAHNIRFLDVLNYLGGQAVTLRSFVANFAKDQKDKVDKAWFPYKFLKKIEKPEDLKKFEMPEISDFISDMGEGNTLGKDENEIKENYSEFIKLWHEKGCTNLYDWIIEYVKIDCLCMIPAVETLQKQWQDRNIDLFSNHCTIQSANAPYLFSTMPPNVYFTLPDRDTMTLLREKGVVGGLAEIFTRHQEAGVTPVQPGSQTLTQSIESLDSNSQYLAALASEMPVGPYLVRKGNENFWPRLQGEKRATSAIQWIDYEAQKINYGIRHTLNGGEPTFYYGVQMRPDGYCHELDMIYEYDGCDTHGCDRQSCPKSRLTEEISPVTGQTYNEMRKKTMIRNAIWQSHHNKLIVKQECEFLEDLKYDGRLKQFIRCWMLGPQKFGHNTCKLSETSMANKLISGEIFGFAQVDLECDPEHPDYEKLKMFPPIIRHLEINRKMIPEEILQMGKRNGIDFVKPRKNLVACMTGKEILMYTPLLKYLCEIGVNLTKVHQVIQFQGNHFPFKSYENIVANMRREGDRTCNTVVTNLAKHMGASAWGRFAFNPQKRNEYKITDLDGFKKMANCHTYVSHLELNEGYTEVQLKPRTVKFDLPIQIAVAVYGAAKLNLLRFVHSYILKYFDHTKLAICGSDTDSVIVSWGSDDPDSLVLPHLRDEYEEKKYDFIVDDRTPESEAYTKRQPGLFKVEKKAKGFIGLSAKCYIMSDKDENTLKHAAKGVSAKTNTDILRYNVFKESLYKGDTVQATNISFRTVKNRPSIYTTRATRTGLQPFYVKRKLLPPHFIFSEPLDESLEHTDNT